MASSTPAMPPSQIPSSESQIHLTRVSSTTAALADSLPPTPASPPPAAQPQDDAPPTVFYLAYGSNLARKTFLGRRGIRPLGAKSVVVPALKLTFDLPGMPYKEPCFANSALRPPPQESLQGSPHECGCGYRKDTWHKGLVGVVYELTPQDFAKVLATEGGGSSYQDVTVDCFVLDADPSLEVPADPASDEKRERISAHTLLAPASATPRMAARRAVRTAQRADPSYAQPSARYLGLITSGAAEHALPSEYREWLARLRPYTTTETRQRVGAALVVGVAGPAFLMFLGLLRATAGKDGRAPKWVTGLMSSFFQGVWTVYDWVLRPVFGDGERTVGDGGCECDVVFSENEKV